MPKLQQSKLLRSPTINLGDVLRLAGLDPDRANRLEQLPHHVLRVRPGAPFRHPGEPRPDIMLVGAGLMSKYKLGADGSRQIVALRFPGEPILPRWNPAPYGLQAIRESEIFVAEGRLFMMALGADQELLTVFQRMVQRNESIAYEWLVNRARRDRTARVVHLLLETAFRSRVKLAAKPLHNPFTQAQIAQITGQTSVNVNRVLAELEEHGWIERKGREMIFTDLAALQRLAEFNTDYLS